MARDPRPTVAGVGIVTVIEASSPLSTNSSAFADQAKLLPSVVLTAASTAVGSMPSSVNRVAVASAVRAIGSVPLLYGGAVPVLLDQVGLGHARGGLVVGAAHDRPRDPVTLE